MGTTTAAPKIARRHKRTVETRIRFPMGRPRYAHPWNDIPVGWRGTITELAEMIHISPRAVYMMIEGQNGCSLPPGFVAERVQKAVHSRHYIKRVSAEPINS